MSRWIRCGKRNLCCLLEDVEACYRSEDENLCNKTWVEDETEFTLELTSYEADGFIICLICCVKTKRFTLSFLQGRSILGDRVYPGRQTSLSLSSFVEGNEASIPNYLKVFKHG